MVECFIGRFGQKLFFGVFYFWGSYDGFFQFFVQGGYVYIVFVEEKSGNIFFYFQNFLDEVGGVDLLLV